MVIGYLKSAATVATVTTPPYELQEHFDAANRLEVTGGDNAQGQLHSAIRTNTPSHSKRMLINGNGRGIPGGD